MKNLIKKQLVLLPVAMLFAQGQFLHAIELMSPATQLGKNKVHGEIYYRRVEKQDLVVTQGGSSTVNVKNSTITSATQSDADIEGSGSGVMARVTFQPFETGPHYYILGGISNYDLKVPSGTFSNTFATEDPGMVFGGGIKYTLVPYTIVTPALSVDLSATHSRYKLTRFRSGDAKVVDSTGFLLTVMEIQAALTLSKKFMFNLADNRASIDPYLGVKVIRTRTGLDDLSNGDHISGTRVGVAPFFGFKFKPLTYAGIVVEGSLLNETSASVGLTFGF